MHKIRQLLLFLERGLSQRSIEKELHISRKTIGVYHQRFRDTGLEITALLRLPDEQLEQILGLTRSSESQEVDPRTIHFHNLIEYFNKELSRTGVTRLLLWQEYIHDYPSGFQYSRFCELLQEQLKIANAVMHFEHHPGKLMEVDFAGDPLYYVDPSSGEIIACPVFVGVLPFSGLSYVEALPNAKLVQVVKALNNTVEFFGGVPLSVKSDNM
ncbi:MAG: hypothetical protein ABIS36_07390, partial [Chryseolinea sp.]